MNKNIRQIKVVFSLLLIFLIENVIGGQIFHPDIVRTRQIFKNFGYQTVIDTSRILLQNTADLDTLDIVELYRLSAVSYYSLTRMDSSLAAFAELLKIDPSYELDRRENSPKIIAFFSEIKRTYTQPVGTNVVMTSDLPADTVRLSPLITNQTIAYSMLLPGSGHRRVGEYTKGWVLSGLALASLGSAVYFTIETNQREKDYLGAIDKADISAKYEDYNQAYRIRNTAWVLFGAIWIYTQADLLFFAEGSPEEKHVELSITPVWHQPGLTSLNMQIKF